MDIISEAKEAIKLAEKNLPQDPHLANYVLRDIALIKKLNLDELAWANHHGFCVENDVKYLIERLNQYIEGATQ